MNTTLHTFADPLRRLTVDTPALWGKMTAQHMVEHLISSIKVSNGKAVAPLLIGEREIPIRRRFLFGDKPFARNMANPLMGEELLPLKRPDLETAIGSLFRELDNFYAYFSENPEAAPVQPFFGPLSKEEWEKFHTKHFTHHFTQFNLL